MGESITLNNYPCTVVGILPPGEYWLEWFDLYVPLAPDPNGYRGNNIIWPVGRLRPGVTIEDAAAEWDANAARITAEYPEGNTITGVTFLPLDQWLIEDHVRQSLWILLGAVGFVLLIACANLANLLLARASGRRREIAVTAALGAGRARIVRQMITESILLALLGGVLGVLLSVWAVGILTRIEVADIPRIETLPAVRAAGAVSCAPLAGVTTDMGVYAEGWQPGPDESTPRAEWRLVSPEFFTAMGLTILAGRTFSETDVQEDPCRVVISASLARTLWEERDVIGRRLFLWANPQRIGTVIGVVSDMTERGQVHGPRPAVYFSYDLGLRNPVTFVVHAADDPIPVVPDIRALLGDIDPDLPLSNIRTMSEVVTGSPGSIRSSPCERSDS